MVVSNKLIEAWKRLGWSDKTIIAFAQEKGLELPPRFSSKKTSSINKKNLSSKMVSFRCDKEIIKDLKELFGKTRGKNKFINSSLRDAIEQERQRRSESIKEESKSLSTLF